ncbi:MAG: hypothetical protein WBD73_10155 [Candidatus Acidiferrales bacterium]
MKITQEELAAVDQAIVKYLAKMGLGNAEHFAELRMDGIQWATGFKYEDEFLRERLGYLVQIRRITPATYTFFDKECVGYTCLSDRWWNPKLNITPDDKKFLQSLQIEPPPTGTKDDENTG